MTLIRRDVAKIEARAAADLALIKTECVLSINDAVGRARQKFITTTPGQEMIYLAKEREAIAYLAATVPGPADYPLILDPEPDLADYPLITAEVGVTAPTAWQLAQLWVNVSVYWRNIAARIEGVRMRAIAQIEAAPDAEAAQAIAANFRPL